jgi:hypothetical protein
MFWRPWLRSFLCATSMNFLIEDYKEIFYTIYKWNVSSILCKKLCTPLKRRSWKHSVSFRVETEILRCSHWEFKKFLYSFQSAFVDLHIYLQRPEMPGRDFHDSIRGSFQTIWICSHVPTLFKSDFAYQYRPRYVKTMVRFCVYLVDKSVNIYWSEKYFDCFVDGNEKRLNPSNNFTYFFRNN